MSTVKSARSRGILLTVIAIAGAVGYTFGVFLPAQKVITGKRQEIRDKQKFIALADQDGANVAVLEQQLKSAQQQVQQWRQNSALEREGGGLLGELAILAAQAGVKLHRLLPQNPTQLDTLRQQTLVLELAGDFPQIVAFLESVERRPETIWVSSLDAQAAAEDGQSVECALSLVVFTDNREKSG